MLSQNFLLPKGNVSLQGGMGTAKGELLTISHPLRLRVQEKLPCNRAALGAEPCLGAQWVCGKVSWKERHPLAFGKFQGLGGIQNLCPQHRPET